jgi:acyl dehydratase
VTSSGAHPGSEETVRPETVLTQPPALLPRYLRAALPTFGTRPAAAPPVVLRLPEVHPRREDVEAYCAVVGERPGDRLPLLYPHVLGFGLQMLLMTDSAFPFPALGLVHVVNEVTALRPLLTGTPLGVTVRAAGVRPHARGRVVDLVTAVSQDGVEGWRETSTYLRREPSASVPGSAESAGSADSTDSVGPGGPAVTGDAEGLNFSADWRLPADLGRRYARVSGDVNPIHLSAWTARPLGFPRAIAHGMWTAAAVVGALEGRVPDAVRYTVQFRRPILLPARVRLFTVVTPDGARAEVRGRAGNDGVHLTAGLRAL